jgi:hypothetical protein
MHEQEKNPPTIHGSAAEYLTFAASAGDSEDSFEIRYQDENIWLTRIWSQIKISTLI